MKDTFEKMKESDAYWLSPKGIIYNIPRRHINFIRDNLQLFKITEEYYRDVYKKYKEPFGFEGKAREEIMVNVMKRGWIRIRDYDNKGWSVEVWEMDSYAKNSIFKWATQVKGLIKEGVKNENSFYNYNTVKIHVIKLEKEGKPMSKWFIETTFNDIVKGSLFENSKENVMSYDEFKRLYENDFNILNETKLLKELKK